MLDEKYHPDWKLNNYYVELHDIKRQLGNYEKFKKKPLRKLEIGFSEGVDELVNELISGKEKLLLEGVNPEDIYIDTDYGWIGMMYYATETKEEYEKRVTRNIDEKLERISKYEAVLNGRLERGSIHDGL